MSTDEQMNEETIPFYPDHIRTEFYVTLGVFALVIVIERLVLHTVFFRHELERA